MKIQYSQLLVILLAFHLSWFGWTPVCAQEDEQPWNSQFSGLLDDQIDTGPEYQLSGEFSVEQGTRNGTLNISMQIKPGWHGYSQKKLDGQYPTTIKVSPNDSISVTGPFVPNKQPKETIDAAGNKVEEFSGKVVWSAPIEFVESSDIENETIKVQLSGQVCKEACVPIAGKRSKIVAKFSGYTKSESKFTSDHGTVTGTVNKGSITVEESTTLTLSAAASPDWHIYKLEPSNPKDAIHQPTIVYFTKTAGFDVTFPQPNSEPVRVESGPKEKRYVYYCHKDPVDWKIEITPSAETKPGKYELAGTMVFQFCSDSSCDQPASLDFKFPLQVVEKSIAAPGVPINVSFAESAEADRDILMSESDKFWSARLAANAEVAPLSDLALYLLFAFLAGLILNAMPCVLPVIGLKVMSFIQQAGEQRGRIFLLNLVFSMGLLSVFLILATLSAFFGYGWGDWLTKSMTGAIIITGIVFAFGLSMLGIWEIPIPGLSGTNTLSKKSEEEGLLGAFFLGILTTILATPCTGPMLIPAVTFTAGQPPWIAYLIFTTIGLGMALPYLLVGLFPSLIGWLPRPGAWMNTFKQVTGFILMATVVFLMSSFSEEPRSAYLVAMLSLLLCIAIACWWIGRTSLAADSSQQMKAWGTGMAIIAVGGFLAFTYMVPSKYELDWQQYSKSKLGELLDDNRLVFIDFTGPN